MKIFRLALLLTVISAAILLARAEDDAATKKDLAKLQGEWSMTSGTADGYDMPEAILASAKRTCTNDQVTVVINGQVILKAKFTIDASKTPKTIDYDVANGPNKGKKLVGIYEFDGETFRACFAAPGDTRPTDFTSKPDSKRTLSTWKHTKAPAPRPDSR
jgi:uncharacterized protein (TIGR03067 family)